MASGRLEGRSPLLIAALGAALFVLALAHHGGELRALEWSLPPVIAVILDGVPALGLFAAGVWLARSPVIPADRWLIVRWSLGGSVVVTGVILATFLVRAMEGRPIAEPIFPLLVAVEIGAIAGLVAGYYNVRVAEAARRATRVGEALGFVNRLLRHDLRNDLTVIHDRAELLTEGPTEADAADPSAIKQTADAAITRLETTRAVAETMIGEPELTPVDLATQTAELIKQTEAASDVTVTTDLPERAMVRANPGVRSVIDNLLENAIEHNDAEDPQVAVRIARGQDTVTLTVSDNGPGIPDEQKAVLADPAETTDGGLTLIQTLVDRYDGTFRVEDNEPRGAVVSVELPRADDVA